MTEFLKSSKDGYYYLDGNKVFTEDAYDEYIDKNYGDTVALTPLSPAASISLSRYAISCSESGLVSLNVYVYLPLESTLTSNESYWYSLLPIFI